MTIVLIFNFELNSCKENVTSEMEESEWKEFFESNPAPPNLATREQQLEEFCCQQSIEGRWLYLNHCCFDLAARCQQLRNCNGARI